MTWMDIAELVKGKVKRYNWLNEGCDCSRLH